jgi:hypothetical protein
MKQWKIMEFLCSRTKTEAEGKFWIFYISYWKREKSWGTLICRQLHLDPWIRACQTCKEALMLLRWASVFIINVCLTERPQIKFWVRENCIVWIYCSFLHWSTIGLWYHLLCLSSLLQNAIDFKILQNMSNFITCLWTERVHHIEWYMEEALVI